MKIYLLDKEEEMCEQWAYFFRPEMDEGLVEVIHQDFESFMKETDVQAIVSPANSFGRMDGGYDWFISKYYEEIHNINITGEVQNGIAQLYRGEQPVGTAMTLKFENAPSLIHSPTMRFPRKITDGEVIINCMRMVLNECVHNEFESVVIPAFGGGVGEVPLWQVALLMKIALVNFVNPIDASSWDSIFERINEEVSYKELIKDEEN